MKTRSVQVRDTMSIEAILRRTPRAAQVFKELRLLCVGCRMAKFCTPADVAANYGLDPKLLLTSLRLSTTRSATAR